MRTTEESIVYQLLSSIRASELTNDEVITERKLRSFLRSKRAELIYKFSDKGMTIDDAFFQKVAVNLTKINQTEWIASLPNIITLPNNFGVKLMTLGFSNISVLSEESYHLNKSSIVNKHLPAAKIEDNTLTVRITKPSLLSLNNGLGNEVLLNCLKGKEAVILSAILDDPDDGLNYDWTKSPYPVPFETIDALKSEVLRRDLAIILETKSDQVPNSKNDTLRYHDQGQVQK